MIILDTTNKSLEILLALAITTNQLPYITSYVDHTTSGGTPGSTDGTSNSVTAVSVVPAPSASTYRQVKYLSVYNADTTSVTLTVRLNNNGTYRSLISVILGIGEKLEFVDRHGFRILDALGAEKEVSLLAGPPPTLALPPSTMVAGLTAVKTWTSTTTFAVYLGRAERSYTNINIKYNITTLASTITWAEVGIATRSCVLSGPNLLTTRGYTDVSAVVNTTGLKVTTIAVSNIAPGMDIWALYGCNASVAAVMRGGVADDLQSGAFCSATARPSTMGAGTSFAVEGAAVVTPWIAWQGY